MPGDHSIPVAIAGFPVATSLATYSWTEVLSWSLVYV